MHFGLTLTLVTMALIYTMCVIDRHLHPPPASRRAWRLTEEQIRAVQRQVAAIQQSLARARDWLRTPATAGNIQTARDTLLYAGGLLQALRRTFDDDCIADLTHVSVKALLRDLQDLHARATSPKSAVGAPMGAVDTAQQQTLDHDAANDEPSDEVEEVKDEAKDEEDGEAEEERMDDDENDDNGNRHRDGGNRRSNQSSRRNAARNGAQNATRSQRRSSAAVTNKSRDEHRDTRRAPRLKSSRSPR